MRQSHIKSQRINPPALIIMTTNMLFIMQAPGVPSNRPAGPETLADPRITTHAMATPCSSYPAAMTTHPSVISHASMPKTGRPG